MGADERKPLIIALIHIDGITSNPKMYGQFDKSSYAVTIYDGNWSFLLPPIFCPNVWIAT